MSGPDPFWFTDYENTTVDPDDRDWHGIEHLRDDFEQTATIEDLIDSQ